jgi:hypothetical protein
MTPANRDQARRLAAAGQGDAHRAPSRPAFGFLLDRTTLDEVRAWAQRARLECDDARANVVTCAHVPASTGIVDELTMAFDASGRLVNVTTYRTHLDAEAGAAMARSIAASLASELGPPTRSAGPFGGAELATPGVAGLSTISYRFADYIADVTVMNLAHTGVSLREHYMSAAD